MTKRSKMKKMPKMKKKEKNNKNAKNQKNAKNEKNNKNGINAKDKNAKNDKNDETDRNGKNDQYEEQDYTEDDIIQWKLELSILSTAFGDLKELSTIIKQLIDCLDDSTVYNAILSDKKSNEKNKVNKTDVVQNYLRTIKDFNEEIKYIHKELQSAYSENKVNDTIVTVQLIINDQYQDTGSKEDKKETKKQPVSYFESERIISENEWVSHRIPYHFYHISYYLTEKIAINFNQEVIFFHNQFADIPLDVLLYCLMAHYQGMGSNNFRLESTKEKHHKSIFDVFNTFLHEIQKVSNITPKELKPLYFKLEKKVSADKRVKTIDYHSIDLKYIYPMTVAQYNSALKDPDLQTLNIIAGRGAHSINGVSISMTLVVFFSCKNHLDSVFLEDNPGFQSFRIHRLNTS